QGTIRGFSMFSLSDIADSTGLSKSAVFKHFGAMDALQIAVIEKLGDEFSRTVWDPAEQLPPGRQRLDRIFDGWLTWVDGETGSGGCGLVQAQIEFDDQPGPVRDYLRKQQMRWSKVLTREFGALMGQTAASEEAQQAAFEFRSFVFGYNQ